MNKFLLFKMIFVLGSIVTFMILTIYSLLILPLIDLLNGGILYSYILDVICILIFINALIALSVLAISFIKQMK